MTSSTRIAEGALQRAIEEFRAALGPGAVLTTEEETREFRDPFQPPSWSDYLPSAVVLPVTTEEVQEVVRIAGRHGVPLWTHSTGKNNGYGGAGPGYGGAVTVSLRRMNKVLEINEELAYVEVEPGVSFSDLYDAVTAGGHRLMVTNPSLGWGSVVGNTLEHGVTYGVMGTDYAGPCGLEVVTPEGEVLRTGMGAMPGNPAWHTYKRSFGPSIDTLFMQSNLGIVTKMGFWMLPAPEVFMPVYARVWNEDDLGPLIDILRQLRLERTIEGVPGYMNTVLTASGMARRSDFYDGDGPIPDPIIDDIARQLECGRWLINAGLYGHEAQVDMQYARVREALLQIPGAEVWGTKASFEEIPSLANPFDRIMGGVPNLDSLQMINWYSENDGAHVDFSPVLPLVGREVVKCHRLLRNAIEQQGGLDYQVGGVCVNARSTIHTGLITFDGGDEAVARRTYDTLHSMVKVAAEHGYGEYRSHVKHMDEIAAHYSFNDHAYLRFVEKIKDAVDPAGIIMPGKQGVWPQRLRTSRNGAA